MILYMFILTLLSAIFYRLGGMGDSGREEFPELPRFLFNTKARDIGCGLCVVISFFVLGLDQNIVTWKLIVASIVTILLHLAALSTYWDFMFGKDNHYFHGFMCGVALIPFAYITGLWVLFAIRCILVSLGMGLVSQFSGNDWIEECGRGATLPITMLIMVV